MAKRHNRKHSIIDNLPAEIKDTVEDMIKSDFTYADIADYIKTTSGREISITSVWRHASNLNETVETLRMAQENFRVIMDEIQKYPQLDTTEGIIRLLSHYVLESIHNTPEERWQTIDPARLIQQSTSLVRAAAYKNNMDIKNKDILDAGYEQVKVMMFDSLSKERPELYTELSKFIDTKRGDD